MERWWNYTDRREKRTGRKPVPVPLFLKKKRFFALKISEIHRVTKITKLFL
jgi:hypothetical protein